MNTHILGDNSNGFKNEEKIRNYLNNKKLSQLNKNMSDFITFLFNDVNINSQITVKKGANGQKGDMKIYINNVEKIVSIKIGSGNSVHQEKFNEFLLFLEEINVPTNLITYMQYFHWADGSIDNTGDSRIDNKTFILKHDDTISSLNAFFNKKDILIKLADRFLFQGKSNNYECVDSIYYGNIECGMWANRNEIIDFISNFNSSSKNLHFGPMSYQVWNRCLNKNPNTEIRRNVMQIKWGSIERDLRYIRNGGKNDRGTFDGNQAEIDFVKLFNKYKSNYIDNYFKKLNISDTSNYYMIRVTTKQLSSLSNQVVMTRADSYLIHTSTNINNILIDNDYYLDESIINSNNIDYNFIKYSGISIKMADSEHFQILKLTPNSFNSLFGEYEIGAGASLFCKNIDEIFKNDDVFIGWHTNKEKFIEKYFNEINNLDQLQEDGNDLEKTIIYKNIKEFSNTKIKEIIDTNKKIQEIIFNGYHIYEEPYTASYFYNGSVIKELKYIPFFITTGSGRSKGDYTLVLKPKGEIK